MRQPISVTLNANGSSTPIRLDSRKNPFNVGLFIDITGTATAVVEYTPDADWGGVGARWFAVPSTSTSADLVAALTTPCIAIRLTASGVSGGGTARLDVIQAGG